MTLLVFQGYFHVIRQLYKCKKYKIIKILVNMIRMNKHLKKLEYIWVPSIQIIIMDQNLMKLTKYYTIKSQAFQQSMRKMNKLQRKRSYLKIIKKMIQ